MFITKFLVFISLDCLICLTSLEDSDAAPILLNANGKSLKDDLDHDLQIQLKKKSMRLYPEIPPDPEITVIQKPQPRVINLKPPPTALYTIPKFKKNEKNNWEHDDWGHTFGHMWKDTRFNARNRLTAERIPVDSNPVMNYSEKMWTQCSGVTSFFHNTIKVKSWLKPRTYNHEIRRPIWDRLRRIIYNVGQSEKCHGLNCANDATATFYVNKTCSVARNMRLESLIPRYPLHQLARKRPQKH